jgi:hypothetical protein
VRLAGVARQADLDGIVDVGHVDQLEPALGAPVIKRGRLA